MNTKKLFDNQKLYLVTTADENTWPKNKEILFLGEWCKLYKRKEVWSKLKHIDFPYHWDDRKKLKSDYAYLSELYERLLKHLTLKLNKFHNENYSIKYWRIIIGWWLLYILSILFDRWELIRLVSSNYKGLETIIYNDKLSNHIPKDNNELIQLCNDDYWNSLIFSMIVKNFENIKTECIDGRKDFTIIEAKSNKKYLFKNLFIKYFQKISNFLSKENSPFITTTYMTYLQETLLNLSYFRLPVFYNLNKINETDSDINLRDWDIDFDAKNNFEYFIGKIIMDLLPINYLEGYSKLNVFLNKLNWPNKPSFIFSSISFYTDDIFKLYVAKKKESNSKIVTGQHGGHYGIGEFTFLEDYQLSISDIFFSWGWKDNKKNIYPIGFFSKLKINYTNSNQQKILIVTACFPRFSYHLYSGILASQWLHYFNDQIKFINSLNDVLLNDIIIRLYDTDYGWNQLDRWKDIYPNLTYDTGVLPLKHIIPSIKLYVSTYNATTFHESISNNIPTVIFWDPYFWELRDSAVEIFNKLKKAKVFHETPESAAKHINNISLDIWRWWNSEEVKNTIEIFKKYYCNKEEFSIKKMKNILNHS